MVLQLLCFLLAAPGVLSIPYMDLEGERMSLNHRAYRQPSPFSQDIFDPSFVSKEIRGVLSKYEQAAQHFTGIDLNTTTDFIPSVPVTVAIKTIMPLVDSYDHNMDILYYGSISVGTPGQTFTVQLDTGSADLWLPTNCPECRNNFKPAESQTYKSANEPFEESYGRGEVSGTVASDSVGLLGGGLRIEHQVFGAVNKKSEEFARDPNDGLLGLAFREISQNQQQPTFFENLVQKNKLQPMFSMHLTRKAKEGSEICFGCRDETKATGPVVWVPLISRAYWSVFMDGLSLNSTHTIQTGLIAAIDSGTSLIYMPDRIADDFYGQIPGSRRATQFGPNFYSYPCATPLAPSLSFNGAKFDIDMRDFNLGKTGYGSPDCVGGIMGLGDLSEELAIVGAEFMKSWYTTFDASEPGQVGFAPSVNNRKP